MQLSSILYPLIGGGLIGLSVTMMLFFNGRVTGISGILSSALSGSSADGLWRWLFLGGMVLAGLLMNLLRPDLFINISGRSTALVLVAGFLVGFGTVMGSGCTSGHGICGISRMSIRSILATLTFMIFGFLSVQLLQYFSGSFL